MTISYLPFTYISDRHLSLVCSLLGPLRLIAPDHALVPDHMLAADEKGDIELRSVQQLPAGGMIPAVENYKAWAELHQGNLADMAGFFNSAKGRFAMMDETNPSQLKTRIRKMASPGTGEDENPLLQAALFLCMAQEYDRHQETMRQQMGAVQIMEQEMLSRLTGGGDDDPRIDADAPTMQPPLDLEPGGHMTVARIEAWARLALEDAEPSSVYLTSSPAVMDHVRDLFPEAEAVAPLQAPADDVRGAPTAGQRCDALNRLTAGRASGSDGPETYAYAAQDAAVGLTFHRLIDIAPRAMLQRLCPSETEGRTYAGRHDDAGHTLIGLVALS